MTTYTIKIPSGIELRNMEYQPAVVIYSALCATTLKTAVFSAKDFYEIL